MTCNGCGGIVGLDCFNPQECEWITLDMARRHEQQEDFYRWLAERFTRWQEEEFEFAVFEATAAGVA